MDMKIDLRGEDVDQIQDKLMCLLPKLSKHKSLWLICDHEPTELYQYLIDKEFNFQTFIISNNEFCLFVGSVN
jgi:uncharacterized protein (DUF2249 family)